MATSRFDQPWCKAKIRWCSIDAHLYQKVVISYLVFLHITAANAFNVYYNSQLSDQLPDLKDQKSLTLS
jgi:hypothetical protein